MTTGESVIMSDAQDRNEVSVQRDENVAGRLTGAEEKILRLARSIEYGALTITFANRSTVMVKGPRDGPRADISLINADAFLRKTLKFSDVGVAESYIDGDWTSRDVTSFLHLFIINREAAEDWIHGRPFARLWMSVQHWLNGNSKRGSKRNISAHYDLGNAFYSAWLDRTMTYSSALFGTGADDLPSAQNEKYRNLARATGIESGHEVLEIGCGWGGFAEFAAREIGCNIKALTISREQFDYARKRVHEAGLSDKVDIVFQDYRDECNAFDRIVSIEMFEAVGEKYWPVFFDRVSQCLKSGGRAGLQIITIQNKFFHSYRRTPDFIQRYIFPGGMLPSPEVLNKVVEKSGLSLSTELVFGLDYARTLAEWRGRFHAAWPAIQPLGFDERFRRLWELYLYYCEAGFRSGNIDVRQLTLQRG